MEVIVIDNGSSVCRLGFGGNQEPTVSFPSLIGTPKPTKDETKQNKKAYIGEQAQINREILKLKYPIERGTISNWDDMEKIWHHGFHDLLHIDPSNYSVLLSEAILNPIQNTEKMTEIMFEKFRTRSLHITFPAVLSLYSVSSLTGIVLNSGDGVTQIVPIHEGYPIANAIARLDLAGRDLTRFLMELLNSSGERRFSSITDLLVAKDLKEKLCYVAPDFEREWGAVESAEPSFLKNYQLPDGKYINVGKERFTCAEALFQPSFLGTESPGIHELLYDCVEKCPVDIRRDLYSHVLLDGGTTMFVGFVERIQRELSELVPLTVKVATPNFGSLDSVWLGGSILAEFSTVFRGPWMTKLEYDDIGPTLVRSKCFSVVKDKT